MPTAREKTLMRVAARTIFLNALLSAMKLAAGFFGHSVAMLSDAVHSLSDVLSTCIVMIGVKMAGKEADKDHPYGHERFESVAALILAAMLAGTGLAIGYSGLSAVLAGNYDQLATPGRVALIAALISIAVKEGMYWYTRATALKTSSDALMADAWHHRSDALSSVGSFAGILGARMGFPVLDSVAALIICLFILKAAFDIACEATGKMTDRSVEDKMLERIRAIIMEHPEVKRIDALRTRVFGDKVFMDLEISVNGDMTLKQAHAVAHAVHDRIEADFSRIKHCMVHVNPDGDDRT